jgi:hypothetical protein
MNEFIHRRGTELTEVTQSKFNLFLTLREIRQLRPTAVKYSYSRAPR